MRQFFFFFFFRWCRRSGRSFRGRRIASRDARRGDLLLRHAANAGYDLNGRDTQNKMGDNNISTKNGRGVRRACRLKRIISRAGDAAKGETKSEIVARRGIKERRGRRSGRHQRALHRSISHRVSNDRAMARRSACAWTSTVRAQTVTRAGGAPSNASFSFCIASPLSTVSARALAAISGCAHQRRCGLRRRIVGGVRRRIIWGVKSMAG